MQGVTNSEPKERSISWRLGNDPKENAIETTSARHAFAGANANTIGKLSVDLDHCKVQISLLEEQLRQ